MKFNFLPQIAGVQTASGQQKGRIIGMWLSECVPFDNYFLKYIMASERVEMEP